jgi:hypothetical protein
MIAISVLSTQYIQIPVTATLNGSPYNPTADVVSFAFLPYGTNPGPADWNGGTWVTTQGGYLAQILIGPANGGVALPAGSYQIWLRITDSIEVPVQRAGDLEIT